MLSKRAIAYTLTTGLAAAILFFQLIRKPEPVAWLPYAQQWDPLPLTVALAPSLERDFSDQFRDAIDEFNKRVGCKKTKLLVRDSEFPRAHVITPDVRWGCGGTKELPADVESATYFCKDKSADVLMTSPGHVRVAYLTFLHEFVHLFGVDHAREGLMIERPKWAPEAPPPWPTLSDEQAAAIRGRFCP